MDENSPRQASPPQSGLYTTIALYAAANALSLAVFLIIYHVSAVLADFRDPMLYAFLCSIALRGPKDWLVEHLDWHLGQDRSLIVATLTAIAPPYITLQFIWAEAKDAVKAFKIKVKEIRDEYQRNMERGRRISGTFGADGSLVQPQNGAGAAVAGGSPRRPATAPLPQLQQPYALTVYAKAGLRTFTSRKERKKRRKRAASAVRKQSPSPASNKLLSALVVLTIAWALVEWIRDSWSRTAHAALMTGIIVTLTTIFFRSILNRVAIRTSLTASSPSKTPASAAAAVAASGGGGRHSPRVAPWTVAAPGFKQPNFHENSPRTSLTGRTSTTPTTLPPESNVNHGINSYYRYLDGFSNFTASGISKCSKALGLMESPIRALLRRNLHAIVTALLIFGLIIGTMSATAFFTVRIIGEARGVLGAARDVFPAAWPSITAATPLLVDELTDVESTSTSSTSTAHMLYRSNEIPLLSLQQQQNIRNLQQVASGVPLPAWLQAYREDAVSLAQRSLPGMASWLEERIYGLMRDHNLTDTLWDARLLYEAAQGPRACSDREKSKILVTLAKAEVKARKAREEEEKAGKYAGEAQRALAEAVAALSSAMEGSKKRKDGSNGDDGGGGQKKSSTETDDSASSSFTNTSTLLLGELQDCVVSADAALSAAKESHKIAAAALDDAERARRVADGRSQLCITGDAAKSLGTSSSLLTKNATNGSQGLHHHQGGLLAGLTDRLSSAYIKIFRQWRAGEGITELYKAILYAINGITQRSGGSTTTAADLTRLQRLAQAAAVPLISLGKAAAASVGTTTAAAVMGSLGLFRLGLGVVHAGVQAALFLTLLYYLLAAQTDPLARAVELLPLPPAARLRAAAALNAALGGVFMSMLKLAAFHGLFSWITFRIFGAPLAYTTSVASAAFALLPFVPTYSIALPGCAVVALQGRVAAGVTLMVLHFFAYYVGDTVVLEDSGGHPFMMSLAILGGLWTFSNPLLGCLLGPTLLSLLTALGTLHTELMGGSSGTSAGSGGGAGGAGGAASAMLFSPVGGAGGSLFKLPPPVLTTPEGGQVLAAPATLVKVSSPGTSPAKSPRGKTTTAAAAAGSAQSPQSAVADAESVSFTGLPEDQFGSAVSLDAGDEVQSELTGGQESSGGEVKKSGFSFRRKKQNVNFDTVH